MKDINGGSAAGKCGSLPLKASFASSIKWLAAACFVPEPEM